MGIAWALFLGACAFSPLQDGADGTRLPKDPIKDWKYRLKDLARIPDPQKPGQFVEVEEVTLILEGKEAIPVGTQNKVFDLRGVKGKYFTLPEKDKISKEISVEARRGRFDKEARTLKLEEDVRVVKRNDEEVPPQADTVLVASSVLLRFNQMFECPSCKRIQKLAGRCPEHGLPLKPTTVTSVEADHDFVMTGPEGVLAGWGLETDDAIQKDYHIARNGFVEFQGGAPGLSGEKKKASEISDVRFSQIFSKGPLVIAGPVERRVLRGRDGMRVDRIDASGTLTMTAREMTIVTVRDQDPESGALAQADIRDVDALGDVVLDGVTFEDGTTFHSRSDALSRRLEADLITEHTLLSSSGSNLVRVVTGASSIDAHTVRLTKMFKKSDTVSEFDRVEKSSLVAGSQHFNLAGDHLRTLALPNAAGKTDLRDLDASGHVVLGGLAAAGAASKPGAPADPGVARADTFHWEVPTNRGWLKARPLVHIVQGSSTIEAPLVLLESSKIMVLKGPKQVHMIKKAEGAKEAEDYRATCAGDLVMDQETHRLWMWNECSIRTREMLLHADRMVARLTEAGGSQGIESLKAWEKVHAVRESDQMNLYGQRLSYRFKDNDLKVYGEPFAIADTGRMNSTQEQIRVYEAPHPQDPKRSVRYTEMVGGSDGVSISIDEHPPTQTPARSPKK